MIDAGCTQVIIVNSGFTRPKFTKFVHDVLIVAAVNTPNGIAIFQSVSEERLMKLSRPNLPIYPLKLVAMTTSLDRSEKRSDQQYTTKYLPFGETLMKIGLVDSEVNCLQGITKPEVRNVSHRHQRRTEPPSQATCIDNLVTFVHPVFEICSGTKTHPPSSGDEVQLGLGLHLVIKDRQKEAKRARLRHHGNRRMSFVFMHHPRI